MHKCYSRLAFNALSSKPPVFMATAKFHRVTAHVCTRIKDELFSFLLNLSVRMSSTKPVIRSANDEVRAGLL